ncbi:TonB-dependent receptor [Pedobacter sp. P351]|uniref:TonB-dependent receptor n=1 Tax=Pedobacter superstes TaxID=3133441 RepID=UPI00309A19F9
MKNFVGFVLLMLITNHLYSQTITGTVNSNGIPVSEASIKISELNLIKSTDSAGRYSIEVGKSGKFILRVASVGYKTLFKSISINENDTLKVVDIELKSETNLNEVVITGTLKEVSRLESPVPVEIYNHTFFRKNPTPSIFDALQNVNGVRPQLNCNVCNTGDIHINGLEGPYTMVLIDGMPLVSSLSTVYGLSGIPNSLIERVEIVKGPASSLYGSEAVGGLINIITKSPKNAPVFSADVFSTNWNEINTDIGFKFNAGKATALSGLNYYNYQNPVDNNGDNFTDVTLQHRISLFQKWIFERNENRLFSLAGRYFYEDRWGGDMSWNRNYRGGNVKYGESIFTKRWEMLGAYQLPVKEKLLVSFSYNNHQQNSVYGTTSYIASQHVAFSQLTWDKKIHRHDLLAGIATRYTFYDDNTQATSQKADETWLPGVFLQDEIKLHDKHNVLLGLRYDYNSNHGNIFTPRFAYKWKADANTILRLNAGTGFRIVNLFTEDHAALTGARTVEIKEELKPEKTFNVNLNFLKKIITRGDNILSFDGSAWFTRFNNRIIADYQTDPNKIIYDNLNGFAISKGVSANVDLAYSSGLKFLLGATLMDVYSKENDIKAKQLLTEPWMGTWSVSYPIKDLKLAVDYTGNIYGPMALPTLGGLDPREKNSPVWSIQNIQFTFSGFKKIEFYGGVKNLLNWTPIRRNPFIIARTNDPFDKEVEYESDGQVMATGSNPYALTFDPTYMYAPNQGIRGFFGLRYVLK